MKQKQNLPVEQKSPMSVRSLYVYFQVSINRKIMLEKIEKGLSKEDYPDMPDLDKTEDEISKDVLSNWRQLSKKERLDYCQYILDNSIKGQMWAFERVEFIKQKFKNKIAKIKRGLNPFNKK